MRNKLMQWNKRLLPLYLCLAVLCVSVCAVQLGSIQLTLRNEMGTGSVEGVKVYLYQVARLNADDELVYTNDFRHVSFTTHELFHEDRAVNAQLLQQYVLERSVPGKEKLTDAVGKAKFEGLEEGAYLICCADGQTVHFRPFLVFMPTEIDAVDHYEVDAQPKVSDGKKPTPGPGGGPTPGPGGGPTPGPGPTVDPGTQQPTEPTPGEPKPGEPSLEEPDQSSEPSEPGPTIPQTGVNMIPVYLLVSIGVLLVILGVADLTRRGDDDA